MVGVCRLSGREVVALCFRNVVFGGGVLVLLGFFTGVIGVYCFFTGVYWCC